MIRFIQRGAQSFDGRAAAALSPYAGVTARLLHSRGILSAEQAEAFLNPSLAQLHDPMLMSGMPEAAALLARAKEERLPVVVYGDYDVDGVCACALLTLALKRYGVDAHPHVPLREEGYGLNVNAVRELAQTYRMLVTVDLGITNHEEVRLAQSLGMSVIVTDHHGLGLEESPADAVMNPLLGNYPYRRLCGTGVAFKLAQALLGIEGCQDFLDLAALATVADIVPLTGENRVLVALGLPLIAARSRVGMKSLLNVSGGPETVDSETLGFRLGPRLNAAGRLGSAAKGVLLMMTEDEREAELIAQELDALNTERRAVEAALVREAEQKTTGYDFIQNRALIVKGENWHAGVIGLVAGRLCQRYYCPVCVLSETDGMLHGSLRSIPGVHIHHCLQKCDDLLLRYGGHEQAAGVTLAAENYEAFRERLNAAVSEANAEYFVPAQEYDAEIALNECTDALYNELQRMAPFGCENPSPLFAARDLAPEEFRAVGADGAHLKLTMRQRGCVLGGIAFSMGAMAAEMPPRVDGVFSLGRNTFRGVTSLQMEVKALAPVKSAQSEALERKDGEREQEELLDGLLDAFSAQAGKTAAHTECIQVARTWDELSGELQNNARGLLLVARTSTTALRALTLCDMDAVTHAPTDPRGFHTLLTAPCISAVGGHWRQVWLLDGALCKEEAALWQERCPDARVYVPDGREALQALAETLDAGDEKYRRLYKAVHASPLRTLKQAAEAAGLSCAQTRLGLHAFHQLGLIVFTQSPFSYQLCPIVKCSLSDSPLLAAVRALARGELADAL